MPAPTSLTETLLADKAVAIKDEDSFKRYEFARHLADTICERRSVDSLVIGLYGKWGSGKSSVLNFIRAELAGTDVLTVSFNPWRFNGEEQLLLGFFTELSVALEKVVTDDARKAAKEAIAIYTKKIVSKLHLLNSDSQDEILKEFKSHAKLEEVKEQVNELLRTSGKRVLVLIDDIDRLSAPEIHAILRLVKLTGDFHYTTYLLAFDEKVVAEAIGKRYAGGSKRNGRRYLEKIVQVPLHLPIIQREAMQKYFQDNFSRSLAFTNTKLPEGDYQRLVSILSDSIMPQITTPRHVTRYSNTLLIILPLLRGEANMVDLMLLEALKLFYPKLYKLVARNKHLLTGVSDSRFTRAMKANYNSIFGTEASELGHARTLLFSLFPKLEQVYGGSILYSLKEATEDHLYTKKVAASAYYFRRYFSYAVQDGEIPEADFNSFLAAMVQCDVAQGISLAKMMIARASEREFTNRLEKTISLITPEQVRTYFQVLELLQDEFTVATTGERTMQPVTKISNLLISYVLLLPKEQVREELALLILRLKFAVAFELFRDITEYGHWSSDHELAEILTPDDYDNLARIIVTRSLAEVGNTPWYEVFDAPFFLRLWTRVQGKEPAEESLRKIFDANPSAITTFLENIAPLSLASADFGNVNIREHTYESLKEHLDIHYLYKIARSVIKDEQVMTYKGDKPGHQPGPLERLHQLIYFYQKDKENTAE